MQSHTGILNVKTSGKTSLIVNNKFNSICDDFEPIFLGEGKSNFNLNINQIIKYPYSLIITNRHKTHHGHTNKSAVSQ